MKFGFTLNFIQVKISMAATLFYYNKNNLNRSAVILKNI
jgi:hypothetical protein